ncbi:hypothetical protein DSECCO2_646110 [anaerobic digester metagenome]
MPALKTLMVAVFSVANLNFQPFRQCVDNRRTDTVQTAGNLIAPATEFATGMQNRKHDGNGRNSHFWLNTNRNAASVIGDTNHIVRQNIHLDIGTKARERLVNGIVDNLVYQMVQPARAGRTDIHTGTLSHRFKPFKHLYLVFVIMVLSITHKYSLLILA